MVRRGAVDQVPASDWIPDDGHDFFPSEDHGGTGRISVVAHPTEFGVSLEVDHPSVEGQLSRGRVVIGPDHAFTDSGLFCGSVIFRGI